MKYRLSFFLTLWSSLVFSMAAPVCSQTLETPLADPALPPAQTNSQTGNLPPSPQAADFSNRLNPIATEMTTSQPSAPASVEVSQANNSYRSQWAQKSVQVLQENGIQLPPGINYTALITQEDFVALLAKVSSVGNAQLRSNLLNAEQSPQGGITRAEAIHLMIGAFGLTESLPGFATQPSKFTDLPPDHPAYASLVLAERVHLINGYPDHTIRPNEELSWGEGLILLESIYSWRKALPTTAPEWVKNYQKRQNMWFQLLDGFRLLLTLTYLCIAAVFMLKTWRKARTQSQSPYGRFSFGLALVSLLLGGLWISELLFNYQVIPREAYALLAMISVFVSVFLLKLSSDLDNEMRKPKPQSVIDAGFVTSINHEKGELFIKDKRSQAHKLAVVSPDSKVLRKTGRKTAENAFLSDIQVGDVVSLRGTQLNHESLLQVERITLVESATTQQEQIQEQANVREYVHTPQQQQQQQVNRIVQRPPNA